MIRFEGGLIELHPKELALIIALRDKFPNAEVSLTVQNGVPVRLKHVIEFDYLSD